MPVKKTAATEPHTLAREGFGDQAVRNVNPIVGGNRPLSAEMLAERSVFGRPPESVRSASMPEPAPVGAALPFLSVSRQVVGAELIRLRSVESAIERDLSRPAIGAGGSQLPHLIQIRQEQARELELIRDQIAALSNLDDYQLRVKAFELGAR